MSAHAIRLHYALLYSVVGAWLPYMPVHLNQLNLSDWQIGWILGFYGLAVFVMPPVFTHLADRHVSARLLIAGAYVLTTLSLAVLSLVESFWLVLGFSLVFSMSYTPLFSLMDGLTFQAINQAESSGARAQPYHSLRIWGSVGFMIPSLGLFLLMRYAGLSGQAAVFTAAGCAAIGALASPLLPRLPVIAKGAASGMPGLQALRIMNRAPVRAMIGSLFLGFIAISLFYAFYSRLLQKLGIAPEWVGLIVNLGVAVEIVFILASRRLLAKLKLRGLVLAGAAALVLRLSLIAAFPECAILVILTQILHAPIVLWMYVVPPMYLNLRSEPGYHHSMQGLYSMLCYGAARLLGSVLGGYTAEFGLQWSFVSAAVLSAGALVWIVAGFRDDATCSRLRGVAMDQPVPEP